MTNDGFQIMPDALGLPHRPPFVFVRNLISCRKGESAECETWFDSDDPMFAGHFPGNPLVPGVIVTEALAQTAGIAAASAYAENARALFLLSAIRGMKFFGAVRPDQRIVLRAQKLAQVQDLLQFKVEALVEESTVAQGELVLSIAGPKFRRDEHPLVPDVQKHVPPQAESAESK